MLQVALKTTEEDKEDCERGAKNLVDDVVMAGLEDPDDVWR